MLHSLVIILVSHALNPSFLTPEPCKSVQAIYCACSLCVHGFLYPCFCSSIHVSFPPLVPSLFHIWLKYFFSNVALYLDSMCSSASEIKNTPLKLSYIYQCVGCDSFHLQCLARTVPKVCFAYHLTL